MHIPCRLLPHYGARILKWKERFARLVDNREQDYP